VGVESTVLDMTREKPIILRPGALSRQEIESFLGPVDFFDRRISSPRAPGQLPMHYSPRKALYIVEDMDQIKNRDEAGVLLYSDSSQGDGFAHQEVLSPRGDPLEAATRLFSALHSLDRQNIRCIYAQPIPEEGLGLAVMERLLKASEKQAPM